jgi:hypothetical protein
VPDNLGEQRRVYRLPTRIAEDFAQLFFENNGGIPTSQGRSDIAASCLPACPSAIDANIQRAPQPLKEVGPEILHTVSDLLTLGVVGMRDSSVQSGCTEFSSHSMAM